MQATTIQQVLKITRSDSYSNVVKVEVIGVLVG